jgi:hemolysin III
MSLAEDGRPLSLTWHYTPREILADGIVHGVGVAFGVAGAIALILTGVSAHLAFGAQAALFVYALALVLMLAVSAIYNLHPVGPRKWLLRRADHALIYLMIAGTYTPLVALVGSGPVAYGLLAMIWAVALVGIAVKLFLPGRFDRLSIALYLILGWSGLLAYESVIAALQPTALGLLAIGGVLYSIGVVFHVWRTLPFQNAIWHAFVLVATACHYGTIWSSLRSIPLA